MDNAVFNNFIGGKESLLSKKTFEVGSPFYSDYIINVPDSNLFDLKSATSRARSAIETCNKLHFDDKREILKNASERIKFSNDDLEYIVKMTGMPIARVEKYTNEIPIILNAVYEAVEKRIGVRYGKIARHPIPDYDIFKFLEPTHGFVYAVTPGNDPRVVPFVASWLVTLGIPCIFKVSKNDILTAQKVIHTIIESGYPAGGLGMLCWDTSKENSKKLNFDLVDSSQVVWAFGDNNTVDNLLRFEEVENGHRIDHFSDKIILRHATGRAAAICDSKIDQEKIADMITESALYWPIGCNALKAVFDANDKHGELVQILAEKFNKLTVGDPMDKMTEVGYADSRILKYVFKRINELKLFGLIEPNTGKLISDIQASPIMLKTRDKLSEFLSREFLVYILTVKQCASFDEAVNEVNESSGSTKRIAIAVFSDEEDKVLRTTLRAHHIKRLRHTTELDILFHEGNDYLHKLTVPQIHRVKWK